MEKLKIYYRALNAFIVHFLIFRTTIFIVTDKSYTTEIFARKFISGFMYDIIFLFALALIFGLIHILVKSEILIKGLFILSFILVGVLDLVNHYMLGYFSDGLASYGVLVEYLADLDTVAKMGMGTFNPAPPILFFLPIVFFFIPFPNIQIKFFSFKPLKRFLVTLALINLVVNQSVKLVRVNKNAPLESNTALRIIRSGAQTNKIFAEVKKLKNTKLTEQDLALVRTNKEAEYLSDDYPLLKKDKMPPVEFQMEKPNIVMFVFESVSSFETGIKEFYTEEEKELFKEQKSFTPFFDSLLKDSIVFPNFYAHGTFTSLGQVSMLCSIFDPISALDGMGSIMRNYSGVNVKCLPEYLKQLGYRNMFFNGYRKEFDNKAFFFPKIKLDEIYCREEIKAAEGIEQDEHTWGLEDSTVVKYMVKKAKETKGPFFSMFMSVNTHAPYNHIKNLPEGYTPHEYSLKKTDDSIKLIVEALKDEPWFNNTIFVFTADNGTSFKMAKVTKDANEDLYYNRVPFMIYAPGKKNGQVNKAIGSQVDVTPTLFNLMGLNQTTNHFIGKSLFQIDKNYAFQYKHYNNYFTIPKKEKDEIEALRKIHMSFVFNNKFMPLGESL